MGTVHDIGEFGLIDRLAQLLPPAGPAVLEGIGDDCAVLRIGDRIVLVSCDLSVEDVHFRRVTASPEDIGWKAAAAALSDIAAMGGTPLYGLVALACAAETELTFIDALYAGLSAAAADAGAVIVGGDTTRSPGRLTLDVTAVGEAREGRYLSRKGAQPGDILAVTGYPGLSAAGLDAIERGAVATRLIEAHLRPRPRYAEGQWLCRQQAVRAMIDVSDGLVQDAAHLAEAAQLGVDIDPKALPIAPELAAYCAETSLNAADFILSGGEDYELACAVAPAGYDEIARAFRNAFNTPLTAVGTFTNDFTGARVAGKEPVRGGYDHFV